MGQNDGKRIRVVLRWLQIKDTLDPFFKDHGEFRFRSRVTSGEQVTETRFPPDGVHWEISDHPRFSKVDKIDKVLFEGPAADSLLVELFGEEIDRLSPNDQLDDYRREFTGLAAGWVGVHRPGDEGMTDPENMPLWRVGYEIEFA